MKKIIAALLLPIIALAGCSGSKENEMKASDDDMRYSYLSEKGEDTKTAMSVVKNNLRERQTAYERFRVGNMVFIEIHTDPVVHAPDTWGAEREYVVVILDDKPCMVSAPNQELFARFMESVRADPDIMKLNQKVRTALILATGYDSYSDKEEHTPTWVDENGVLVIGYYNYESDSPMIAPTLTAYRLIVDENQNFTLEN